MSSTALMTLPTEIRLQICEEVFMYAIPSVEPQLNGNQPTHSAP
jgi:hypothetical protein